MMEKLIRHKLPNISHPKYLNMRVRNVSSIGEHVRLLIQKIYEEENELSDSRDESSKIDEFVDLLEVADTILYFSMHFEGKRYIPFDLAIISYKKILEIIRTLGISEQMIYEKKKEKFELKGGFREGVIWIY